MGDVMRSDCFGRALWVRAGQLCTRRRWSPRHRGNEDLDWGETAPFGRHVKEKGGKPKMKSLLCNDMTGELRVPRTTGRLVGSEAACRCAYRLLRSCRGRSVRCEGCGEM